MKNTITTVGIVGALVVGAVGGATLTPSAQSAMVEKIDDKNVSVAITPPAAKINIDVLKSRLVNIDKAKSDLVIQCQKQSDALNFQSETTKEVIRQAKDLGVQ